MNDSRRWHWRHGYSEIGDILREHGFDDHKQGSAGGDAEPAVITYDHGTPGSRTARRQRAVWAADDTKSPSRVIPRERGVLGRSPVRVAALMDADKTRAWISTERFAPFLENAEGDQALAFDLYLWHARISGASLTTLHHFEVAL